jgi:DNA-binding CsgD family transcriptional regulator
VTGQRGVKDQPLDKTELSILRWIAQGFSHSEVAKAVGLSSVDMAKYHSQRLYRKLGADNAAHAVFLGIQAGWLDPNTGQPNTCAVPAVAADLVRSKVIEVLTDVRQRMAAEVQDQLSQFAITITEKSA